MTTSFAVNLTQYAGPLDLLLYLVRREELDVTDVSLAKITRQYCDFLEVIEAIDVDATADFLEPVGLLLEMKAKQVLPVPAAESIDAETVLDDPADQLVQRLVEYKRFRDVATILDEQSRAWQMRYGRQADDRPRRHQDLERQPITSIEVWDLVSAFGRILRERQPAPSEQIVYDETPIHRYMARIHDKIKRQQRVELQSLFEYGQHKSALVGMFLAALELTRHHGVLAEQSGLDGPMWLTAGQGFSPELDVAEIENVSRDAVEQSNLPIRPR
jgi:segregation and condensation protein A